MKIISEKKILKKIIVFLVFIDFIVAYKKTFNVLRSILNYSAFVNQMINKTIVPANEELKRRDELVMIKNQLTAEIEGVKIREMNNAAQIRELDTLIPRQKAKIRELEEDEKKYKAESMKYQMECENVEIQITELRNHLKELRESMITDEECESILKARKHIEAQICEQGQVSATARNNLLDISRKIEDSSQVVARMESILDEFKTIDTKARKNDWVALKKLQNEVKDLNEKLKKTQAEITSVKQFLKCQSKTLENNKKKRDEYRVQLTSELSKLKLEVKETTEVFKITKADESKLVSENLSIRDDSEKLYKLASNVVKHIVNQSYDTENNPTDNSENQ